jgi:tetratricopeptide (TPR) repeat protein
MQRLGILGLAVLVGLSVGCADRRRNRANAEINKGIEQQQRSNYSGAVAAFERAIEIDPDYGLPYYLLGMIRLQYYDSPQAAITDLRRAADLMSDHAPTFYQLGMAYLDGGERRAAQRNLERAIELDPEHSRALLRLGEILEGNGEIEAAVDAYMRSIYAEPRRPDPYFRLGSIYTRFEAYDEAIAVFREGYTHTGEASLANELGKVYLYTGELEAAIRYFETAVEANPRSPNYNYNLGLAYAESYIATLDPADRTRAERYLTEAEFGCAGEGSRARCNSIELMRERMVEAAETPEE